MRSRRADRALLFSDLDRELSPENRDAAQLIEVRRRHGMDVSLAWL